MQLYKPEPKDLIRLQINKIGEETQYITLCDCTQKEVIAMIAGIVQSAKVPVFISGPRTRVDVRNCIGGKNGKSKSVSFFGISPKDLNDLIIKKVNQ